MDARFTTTILSNSLEQAPESSKTFLFKAYKSLCMPDPAKRPHPLRESQVRLVPSFRWLRMVLYREATVQTIMACLARQGHRLPVRTSLTLKRIWLTMDIGLNVKRIGLMHNTSFWTDEDLRLATLLMIKLDLRFMDPIDGAGETALRKLLLGQRSLTPLCDCLKRTSLLSRLELLQMYVRYEYVPPNAAHRGRWSILGVPADRVGKGHLERWGDAPQYQGPAPAPAPMTTTTTTTTSAVPPAHLMRPDQLVMREALRRDLNLDALYLDMILYGYIDLQTGQNIVVPEEEMRMPPVMGRWGRMLDEKQGRKQE